MLPAPRSHGGRPLPALRPTDLPGVHEHRLGGVPLPRLRGSKSGRQKVYTGRAGVRRGEVGGPDAHAHRDQRRHVLAHALAAVAAPPRSAAAGCCWTTALYGPSIRYDDEWYRIITSGFLHSGLLHLAFNMYALWMIGNMLEPALGRLRFGIIYLGGLIAGSLGALVLEPNSLAVGASGAIFALFAAAFIAQRAAGIDPWRSGIAAHHRHQLRSSRSAIPYISKGGHLGGLAGGAISAWLLIEAPRRTTNRQAAGDRRQRLLVPAFFLAAVGASLRVFVDPVRLSLQPLEVAPPDPRHHRGADAGPTAPPIHRGNVSVSSQMNSVRPLPTARNWNRPLPVTVPTCETPIASRRGPTR